MGRGKGGKAEVCITFFKRKQRSEVELGKGERKVFILVCFPLPE